MSSSQTTAVHWFRWHHSTVSDPKWRVVARKASHALSRTVTVSNVIAVWAAMLECASQANPRGELRGWSDEDVAAGFDLEENEVRAIREAMQEKTLHGMVVISWNARQPRREDPSAAERKQRQRDKERPAASRDVTDDSEPQAGVSRNVTLEERRGEKEQKPPIPPAAAGGVPKRKRAGLKFQDFVLACREAGERPLPADHAVFVFAADSGIPREYLELAWREFARQYRDTDKTQAGVRGWRQKFENCVRRNWFKLWWFTPEQVCELTTAGQQLKREREAEQKRKADEQAAANIEEQAA